MIGLKLYVFIVLFEVCTVNLFHLNAKEEIGLYYKTPDLVRRHGYHVETHHVTTADGYGLTLHRIPAHGRPPLLLQHGMLCASDTWVVAGPSQGLGFIMADQGYDVWMGNARGNYYSKKHITLQPKQKEFWKFSWHEMGVYDLPAVIDYILAKTEHEQLSYIGHSMGTTMFFVMAASRPEYNSKIKKMVAFAPVVYDGVKGSIFETSMKVFALMPNEEIFPRTPIMTDLIYSICGHKPLNLICVFVYGITTFGTNFEELNSTLIPVIENVGYSGASRQTADHYYQIVTTERFQMYDKFASKRFGKILPMPEYDLSKVTAPVVLMYAESDFIPSPMGVWRLRQALPNVQAVIRLEDKRAQHTSFLFGNHVRRTVYEHAIRELAN